MRPRRSPCSTTGAAAATTPNASAGCRRCSTQPAGPGSAPTWPTPTPWPRWCAAAPPAPSTTAYWQRNQRNRPIRPSSPLTPGPLLVRGDLVLDTPEGTLAETRAALCACGRTRNQPFCDGACGVNGGPFGGTRDQAQTPQER